MTLDKIILPKKRRARGSKMDDAFGHIFTPHPFVIDHGRLELWLSTKSTSSLHSKKDGDTLDRRA